MRSGLLRDTVTFQKYDGAEWTDHLTCHAYINGVSGNEFFIANAGDTAALTVTVTVRYTPDIMRITPMEYRAVCSGIVYELISPADDIGFMHREVKFRAKRIYTEADGR